MQLQSLFSFSAVLALASAAIIPIDARSSCHSSTVTTDANTPKCPNFCAGTLRNQSLIHVYVCGDSRLGPKRLPSRVNLGTILQTYDRFGGLCPGSYLSKWYNETAKSYIYPDHNGFQLNTNSQPINGNVTLAVGTLLDRFGRETGTFMSPQGAPYMQRSLPPSNLDEVAGSGYPYNYHVYNVTKSFDVLSGPIAPWFGQPGEGVQYDTSIPIVTLINTGYLARVNMTN